MKQCDDISALSRELDIDRRLLYRWRDQLDPPDKSEWPPPQTSRESFHLFFHWQTFLQRAIEASATDLGQLTHPFNTQAALQRHHFPDLVVDAFAPEPPLCCRRASIFCKAPLKKSSSRVFSASHLA
jgi:hypothetical protein